MLATIEYSTRPWGPGDMVRYGLHEWQHGIVEQVSADRSQVLIYRPRHNRRFWRPASVICGVIPQ